MKKIIGIVLKVFLITLVVLYISLIIIEYNRYQKGENMLFTIKEEMKEYEDGHVYVYWGLGYKSIVYERTSLHGKEFGHIFIEVREKLPKK